MLIVENIEMNGRMFVCTYSSKGMMIERDGVLYSEAIDPIDSGREYIETDEPIIGEEATEADYLAALERFGVK